MLISQQLLSSMGLILDIVGAALLWRFGIPGDIDPKGRVFIVTSDADQGAIATAKAFKWLERSGLVFLIVGFALQLAANWVE